MSTYNTVVFVTTKSVATDIRLEMLTTADKVESNMACSVWTWDWIESNQLKPLCNWVMDNWALEEHFLFLRTGESDEDVEVSGLYDCGYRIGIIPPESEPDFDYADMLLYLVDSEYNSFLDYVLEYNPELGDSGHHEQIAAAGLADEGISHIWKTARLKLDKFYA